MRYRRGIATALAASVAATALLFAASSPPAVEPTSPARRGLTAKEEERMAQALGAEQGRLWITLHPFGFSRKLTEAQLDYYRARGTNEIFLLNWIAEYGITPEENESLRTVGVDLAIPNLAQVNAYHWAAFADIVILGRIQRVIGNPAGPYHSHYQIRVEEYLKNCTGASPPVIEGKLLMSGPHAHGSHVHEVIRPSEPNLAEGERVIVFLSKVPLSLIGLLQTASDAATRAGIEREYGRVSDLLALAEAPAGFEIVESYKVVWGKAVRKIRTLSVPGSTDVVGLDDLKEKIHAVGRIQEPYCRNRS